MPVPLTISYRGLDASPSVEQQVRDRVEALARLHDRITACKVVLEARHKHHQGNIFHVSIDLTVPGREIVVNRDPGAHHAHADAHVAIRDAFDAARRQLQDHIRAQSGQVKAHEAPAIGRVVTIFQEKDYGFLAIGDGEELYFHRNSVPNGGFARLHIGDKVRYVLAADPGEMGPQASTVVPLTARI